MPEPRFDVLGIGNAIVDVMAQIEEDFLVRERLVKSSMRLVDTTESERLYRLMPPSIEASGGCAGNTVAGVASFGGKAAFIGKIAKDQLGDIYRHDMHTIGIHFDTPRLAGGDPTARSMILITPDGERTMNTYLGASQELAPADIDPATVEAARVTYLEGYLWDRPLAKDAFRKASAVAHTAGRQVSLTLSDAFCVDRFRDEFIGLIRDGSVDVLFANESELKSLY
jgi:sugar/nucleoside kinase (ribokinase family)